MSDDVLITPASRKIEFKDNSGNVDGKIELDSSGNLKITSPGGGLELGDAASDIYVGNGSANIDIIFEQNGEIRGTTGRTITLGQSDSNITVDALNFTTSTSTLFKSQNGITSTRLSTTTSGTGASGQESTSTAPHTLVGGSAGSTQYALLATLPASSNGTYDHVTIEGELGSWTDSTSFRVKFNRRNSFEYDYTLFDHNPYFNASGIVAYQASNGTVTVHAKLTASQYSKLTYKITDAFQATIVDKPSLTTSTPAGTLIFDTNDTSTYTPRFRFPDNQKLEFGAGSDLQIYHDGSNSFIADGGTGDLVIQATHLRLRSADAETYFLGTANGAVELYHNNIKKFETLDNGARVVGTLNINNEYSLPSSDGSANQVLQTNGSGVLSFATVSGGGGGGSTAADDLTAGDAAVNLTTTSGNITIDAQGSDTDIIFKGTDDATDITALTLDMSDGGKAIFKSDITSASGSDLNLSASSSSYSTRIKSGSSTALMAYYSGGYHRAGLLNNGYFRLQTQVDGIDVTGSIFARSTDTGATAEPTLDLHRDSNSPADNDYIGNVTFSGENDAGEKITYAEIGTQILDASDGTEDGQLVLSYMGGGSSITGIKIGGTNQGVELYNGGNLKFQVTGVGAYVTGNLTVTNKIFYTDATTISNGNLDGLHNVEFSSLANNDLLKYNSTAGKWQNTNLGLTVTPTLSLNGGVYYSDQTAFTFTVTNHSSYDLPAYSVEVRRADNNNLIFNMDSTSGNAKAISFETDQLPPDGRYTGVVNVITSQSASNFDTISTDNFKVLVIAQDFGDLQSEVATLNVSVVARPQVSFTTSTYRYWRITDMGERLYITNWRAYSAINQGGTEYPGTLASTSTPSNNFSNSWTSDGQTNVAYSNFAYSNSYTALDMFDNSTDSSGWWGLGTSTTSNWSPDPGSGNRNHANQVVAWDMGTARQIKSMEFKFNDQFTDTVGSSDNSFIVQGSSDNTNWTTVCTVTDSDQDFSAGSGTTTVKVSDTS